jgi:hypothetical protein
MEKGRFKFEGRSAVKKVYTAAVRRFKKNKQPLPSPLV